MNDTPLRSSLTLARPVAEPAPLPYPADRPYPGVLRLAVDATDVERAIFRVRETVPVAGPGRLTLLYPKWLPGFHCPASAIELLAGLEVHAAGARLTWRRDPVEMHAFHVEVPAAGELEVSFQFVSATAPSQGDISVTAAMLALRWGAMLLYPAGHYARQIRVAASVRLPDGWSWACALDPSPDEGEAIGFRPAPLDELVDSPLLAGRHFRRVALDDAGAVTLNLAADHAELLEADAEALAPHRAVVREVDALMGARHFERFDYLAALSDELGGGGVEHQRSCEIVLPGAYFRAWDANKPHRDVIAHEYIHSWNGKFRQGEDSWTPSFERPIRNSLMWVYEGLTQYWGEVVACRSGLWSRQDALGALAITAALYATRPGGAWRAMSDTTRDPIIVGRKPLPWPSWQRSEDYYAEGQLLWLEVDTLIRELSGDTRSLDDFARAFFGVADGREATLTYGFDDVVEALERVAPHDWRGLLTRRLEAREVGAPLDGLTRGGYRLVYRDTASDFARAKEAAAGLTNLRFSIGLVVGADGTLEEVIWDSPAFEAGLVAGAKLISVNGRTFDVEALRQAITEAQESGTVDLLAQRGRRTRRVVVNYGGGHRFPHLEPIEGARARLDEILAPRA